MRRFIEGTDHQQSTLFPECLEDWIGEDNPVRVRRRARIVRVVDEAGQNHAWNESDSSPEHQ